MMDTYEFLFFIIYLLVLLMLVFYTVVRCFRKEFAKQIFIVATMLFTMNSTLYLIYSVQNEKKTDTVFSSLMMFGIGLLVLYYYTTYIKPKPIHTQRSFQSKLSDLQTIAQISQLPPQKAQVQFVRLRNKNPNFARQFHGNSFHEVLKSIKKINVQQLANRGSFLPVSQQHPCDIKHFSDKLKTQRQLAFKNRKKFDKQTFVQNFIRQNDLNPDRKDALKECADRVQSEIKSFRKKSVKSIKSFSKRRR